MKRSVDRDSRALTFGLIGAAHTVEARLEAALLPFGLSLAKFGVLTRLVEAGEPLPLSTLAGQLACVRSNITQLVDRLEADQLVARVPDPEDRRSIRAQLTPEGQRRHAAGEQALRVAEQEAFAVLPLARRQALAELLGVLKTEP